MLWTIAVLLLVLWAPTALRSEAEGIDGAKALSPFRGS